MKEFKKKWQFEIFLLRIIMQRNIYILNYIFRKINIMKYSLTTIPSKYIIQCCKKKKLFKKEKKNFKKKLNTAILQNYS